MTRIKRINTIQYLSPFESICLDQCSLVRRPPLVHLYQPDWFICRMESARQFCSLIVEKVLLQGSVTCQGGVTQKTRIMRLFLAADVGFEQDNA